VTTERRGVLLASRSESRKRLLETAGWRVRVAEPPEDAPPESGVRPEMYARETARRKVESVRAEKGLVAAADTVVVCDGRILGKPRDATEARQMLRALSGKRQRVVTGVCVRNADTGRVACGTAVAEVRMKPLSEDEIEKIIRDGRSAGAAGGYAVREDGPDEHVKILSGSISCVVGLPLGLFERLVREVGGEECLRE